jgi:hypothetical protein
MGKVPDVRQLDEICPGLRAALERGELVAQSDGVSYHVPTVYEWCPLFGIYSGRWKREDGPVRFVDGEWHPKEVYEPYPEPRWESTGWFKAPDLALGWDHCLESLRQYVAAEARRKAESDGVEARRKRALRTHPRYRGTVESAVETIYDTLIADHGCETSPEVEEAWAELRTLKVPADVIAGVVRRADYDANHCWGDQQAIRGDIRDSVADVLIAIKERPVV